MSNITLNPIYEKIIDDLLNQKYSISDFFFSSEETKELRNHVILQNTQQDFHQAAIGNAVNEQIVKSIRGDKIRWIDESKKTKIEEIFFEKINDFILYLNQTCYLGIEESEFHYAVYPEGTFYQRHIDAFKNDDRRTLSIVLYLNDEEWNDDFGGQLALYLPNENGTENELNILPLAGRLAIFDSKTIPHEVKKVNKPRYSITGWLKTRSTTSVI
ncbi:SM-20-related protein [Algoriella xinjiangensis]|uniref:SM-20-related protein n=1 Tax=Algoriella xinjiangensis TaxID=684065 RepID=A0A1I5ACY9_9FLAO|nr:MULTISPECIES: 2OG-Fe(II) oxygenase [Algoriella]MBO6213802.1 2OG-Fe(II) oxygenase [Algoriella sp.]SFN60258.1 SM-20-related protein [Algoriella xinjiangensis]VDH15608.1 Predicted proline hydroxylase [Algoriella xinjiangensis]